MVEIFAMDPTSPHTHKNVCNLLDCYLHMLFCSLLNKMNELNDIIHHFVGIDTNEPLLS